MGYIFTILFWLILNILTSVFSQIGLFMQTLPFLENEPYLIKLLHSQFWATIQWSFAVPMFRIGSHFLNPAQLFLFTFVINFIVVIISNKIWLNIGNNIGDYVTMIIFFIAMYISKTKFFG